MGQAHRARQQGADLRRPGGGRRPLPGKPRDHLRGQDAQLWRDGRPGQPLRPLGQGAGHHPRPDGGAVHAQPRRVPADLVRPDQGRGGHRPDQHQPDRRPAGALPEHLRRPALPGRRRDLAGPRGRAAPADQTHRAMDARPGGRRPPRPRRRAEELQQPASRPPDRPWRVAGQRHGAVDLHQRHHRPAQGRAHQPHARPALHARLRRRDGGGSDRPDLPGAAALSLPPAASAASARRC